MQMIDTIPEALQIRFNKHQGKGRVKRHPLLPARLYRKNDREIDITSDVLKEMADNFTIERPVTIAHPDLDSAKATGWIKGLEVSAYGEGGKALYGLIEWSEEAAKAISGKQYGYISPVFTLNKANEAGDEIGAALLAAGLTNNPHWSKDQPALWEQFTEAINSRVKAAPDAAGTTTQEADMQELEKAKAKIQELEASVVKLSEERDGLKGDLDKAKAKVEEFTASTSDKEQQLAELKCTVEQLSTDNKRSAEQINQMRRKAWLEEFSDRIREKHLRDSEGKATPLLAALDAGDRETFEFMAQLLPVAENPNTAPVGGNGDHVAMTAKEQALEFARQEADKADTETKAHAFSAAYLVKLAELQAQ